MCTTADSNSTCFMAVRRIGRMRRAVLLLVGITDPSVSDVKGRSCVQSRFSNGHVTSLDLFYPTVAHAQRGYDCCPKVSAPGEKWMFWENITIKVDPKIRYD